MLCTTLGYLIFQLFLLEFSSESLTLGIFASLLVFHALGKQERAQLFSWPSGIGRHVVWFSFFWFAYWYAFWLGIRSGGSTVALGFIALTFITTPLAVRIYRKKYSTRILTGLIAVALVFIAGIFLIKLNLDIGDLLALRIEKSASAFWFPAFCMSVAVFAEAGQELTKISISDAAQKGVAFGAVNTPVGHLVIASVPICASYALLLLALHYTGWSTPSWSAPTSVLHLLWALVWYGFWFFVLGLVGNLARQKLINPLIEKHHLDHEAIPPWLGLRLLLLFGAAWIITLAFGGICPSNKCSLGGVPVNLDIMPIARHSYWIGVAIVTAISAWQIARFWRKGFSLHDQPN